MSEFPETKAKLAFILSILSIFCCGLLLAIPALVVAHRAGKITAQYPNHPQQGMVTAAKIISIVVIIMSLLIFALYFIFLVAFAESSPILPFIYTII